MAGPIDRTDEAVLWRRWRSAAASDAAAMTEPDPLLLAAYAEHRLAPEAAEVVEDWLAAHPEAITDILAARRAADAPPAAPQPVLARAAALVVASDGQVVAFRPAPRRADWSTAIRWGAMAASILVTSLLGFTLGNDTYANFASANGRTLVQELLDPPTGLFVLDEDQNT
jgi:hypothetical protein